MTVDDLVRARDRIIGTIAAGRAPAEVLRDLLAALHDVADFDAAALLLTDPETTLPSGALIEGFGPDVCTPFWDNELLDPDFLKFNDLARSHEPVGTLHEATDGDLARSPRYRRLLEPVGARDELRFACGSGTTCWGVGALVRPAGREPFAPEEVRAVRDLLPVAARALRQAVSSRSESAGMEGPGMLVIGPSGEVESMTAAAEHALEDLLCHGLESGTVPTAILATALRARSNRSSARVVVRARGSSGTWMNVHASPLGDDGRVAVMVEPARRSDLLPILLESYDLTARESEVVLLISRGMSTKEIAAELCISAHTVTDHVKVIFSKVGVSSRGELVARLFAEHVTEPMHDQAIHL